MKDAENKDEKKKIGKKYYIKTSDEVNEQEEKSKNDNIEISDEENKQEENPSIESKYDLKKSKKRKTLIIIIISLIVVICISIPITLYIINNDNPFVNKSKIELQYTETNDNVPDGVYITDVSEVVENVMPAIVSITSKTLITNGWFGPNYFGQNQYTEGAGSGIIVGKSDTELLIVTNNHVVEGASELTVQFINDISVDAIVKGTSERKDIAVISIKLTDIDTDTLNTIKIATIGNSDELKVGNGVIAIGNALGYGQSVTTGVVSALDREVTIDDYTNKMIQIDAAINGGNSGGALLNSKGEVVGINSAKYSSNSSSGASIEGMGFAIPISDVNELITQLINGEEVSNGATLGIEGYMTNQGYGISYNVPTGFYIAGITSGSAADKAGLEIGNIITEIDGEKVESVSDIQNVLYDKKSGDEVTLKISYVSGREYAEKEVKVTL